MLSLKVRAQAELEIRRRASLASSQTWYENGARDSQKPPQGNWQNWLILAGRGWGKTRTIVEWGMHKAKVQSGSRGAIVSSTAADSRDVLVEGHSGFLSVAQDGNRPLYEPSKRRLTWPNGSVATLYSAEEPDRLRGPQHHWAICDELAAWKRPDTFDMLMFGLRLGDNPQCAIATTPRPTKIIKELLASPITATVRGSTYENIDNLASTFIEHILSRYEGTRLGRQEIEGAILDDVEGALWTHSLIEQHRVTEHPRLYRVMVGVDPKVAKSAASETGIVVAGLGTDGHVYILADMSLNDTPGGWAKQVVTAYHQYRADRIIGEVNNGGDMVEYTIRGVDDRVSYQAVHASRGKDIRAEPVANLYERGMVHHVGMLATLEDQMCSWTPGEASPDRMDALVWAVWALKLHEEKSNLKVVRVGR